MTSSQAAIRDLVNLWKDDTGNLEALPGIYPDYSAPVITQGDGGKVLSMMRWGMPSPAFALKGKSADKGVTNIRNTASPHWRRWLGRDSRCVVPFTAFSEYQKSVGPKWFALTGDQPVGFFAGVWTQWRSVRKVKDGETDDRLFGFLTTDPNSVVGAIHPKAMPVILTTSDQVDAWLTAPTTEALALQRPLPDELITLIDGPA